MILLYQIRGRNRVLYEFFKVLLAGLLTPTSFKYKNVKKVCSFCYYYFLVLTMDNSCKKIQASEDGKTVSRASSVPLVFLSSNACDI